MDPVHDLPLSTIDAHLKLKVYPGKPQQMYVVNEGDQPVSIAQHSILVNFGRGKFSNTMDKFNPEKHHEWSFGSCNEMVMHSNKLITLKKLVTDKQKEDPKAQVAYHDMKEIEGTDKLAFGIMARSTHKLFFVPTGNASDEQGKQLVSQQTLGGFIDAKDFTGCHCLIKTWAVRWAPGSLQPVRPVVVFTQGCSLKPKQFLSLK